MVIKYTLLSFSLIYINNFSHSFITGSGIISGSGAGTGSGWGSGWILIKLGSPIIIVSELILFADSFETSLICNISLFVFYLVIYIKFLKASLY